MKILRIFLLILIVLGVVLLATQRMWLPSVVSALMANDTVYSIVEPQATSTSATSTKNVVPTPTPTVTPTPTIPPTPASGTIDITATIGPTCPVQRYPETPECADKPYKTTLVLASTQTGKNGGVLITTDEQGHFSENLQPGTYTIRAQSTAILPRLEPQQFTVVAHKRTTLTLMFDSGIR